MQQKAILSVMALAISLLLIGTITALAATNGEVGQGVGLGATGIAAPVKEPLLVAQEAPTSGLFCFVDNYDIVYVGTAATTHYHERPADECAKATYGGFVDVASMTETLSIYEKNDSYVYHFMNGATIVNKNTAEENAYLVAEDEITMVYFACNAATDMSAPIEDALAYQQKCLQDQQTALEALN